jgi:predicted metal-dependent hydrolase
MVKSEINGKFYRVKNNKDSQEKANVLGEISNRISLLVDMVTEEYYDENFKENIELLKKRYTGDNIIENIDDIDTSYTLNKGEEVVMCLTDTSGIVHDLNTLMYVAIHEMAHVGSVEYGHGEEFKNFFGYLLSIAIKAKIYNYVNYSISPASYCGMTIK